MDLGLIYEIVQAIKLNHPYWSSNDPCLGRKQWIAKPATYSYTNVVAEKHLLYCCCVLLCAAVCTCVLLCATVCTCVLLCAPVYSCVHLCVAVCTCVHLCAAGRRLLSFNTAEFTTSKASNMLLETRWGGVYVNCGREFPAESINEVAKRRKCFCCHKSAHSESSMKQKKSREFVGLLCCTSD